MEGVKALARGWLRLDKDDETRQEIEDLLGRQDLKELERRLCTRLSFGTAGLRAPMGAGFSRLNSLTIMQTSQGLAEFLLREVNGAAAAGVVIGYDARHNSKKFAELAAAAFDVKGINVWLYEDLVHTPLVPFGVKHLHAAAGVMITASHNPAQDNGYKVYGSNGCQINAPMDGQIAASILENLQPIMWDVTLRSKPRGSILTSIRARYLETVNGFCQSIQDSDILKSPLFVYTPMHGVGFTYMASIMNKIGLVEKMVVVGEQAQPDPNFPTVKYPNPEEDGALDLAKSTADRNGISLILANDPDADRFAVAEKIDDEWKQLTGDQVGILLADYLTHKMKDPEGPERKDDNFMLTSAVSSQMLSFVAAGYGISFCETLTGFKWLGNCALDLEHENKRVLLAYEEALGYMFPDIVHDKDGIAAAVVFLNACAEWGSPWAKLEQMYQQYGYFETMNTYWRSSDLDTTVIVFERVRKLGTPFPTSVGDRKVLRWRDLTTGYDSGTDDNVPSLPSPPTSQMITCWLSGTSNDEGVCFTIRASGTEPKIKIYLECRSRGREASRIGAAQLLKVVSREWFNGPNLLIEEKYSHLI